MGELEVCATARWRTVLRRSQLQVGIVRQQLEVPTEIKLL